MRQGAEGDVKIWIHRVGGLAGEVPHVDGPLQLPVTAVLGGVIEDLLADAAHVVLDSAVEGACIAFRHLVVELGEDNDEVVLVLVGLEEFLRYHLPGEGVDGPVEVEGVVVARHLHHADVAVVAEARGREGAGQRGGQNE